MQGGKKVLFISHDASQSGATIVLYELLKWLKASSNIQCSVLLKEGGALKESFLQLGDTYLFDAPTHVSHNRAVGFVQRRLLNPGKQKAHRAELLSTLQQKKFDLIYSNTIANGSVLQFLKPLNCKVVSHIHELHYVMDCFGHQNLQHVAETTTHYLAVSNEVKQAIVEKLKVAENKISVAPPFIDFNRVDGLVDKISAADIEKELHIPPGSFVIGCAGSVEWRKGADIFVQAAVEILKTVPNAFFIWVGGGREANIIHKLEYDIKKAGYADRIKFIGNRVNPYSYFNRFNLFLLTSREDPYPLVSIESMYLNKPVVCFEQSGGAPALARKYNIGRAVPYGDVKRMAEVVTEYANSKSPQKIDADALRNEHSVSTVGKKVLEIINQFAA